MAHTYNSPFSFNVMVTMVDAVGGNTGATMTAATITAAAALQVSAGGPYTGTAGVPLTFTATVAGVANPQVTWSFGDGTTGAGLTTIHTYTTANTFTVTVTLTDPATGRTGTASTTAAISVAGITGCIPGLVGFNNRSATSARAVSGV